MSFRTVVITKQSKLSYKNRYLVVKQENEVSIESITKLLKISVKSKYDLLDNLLLIIDLEKHYKPTIYCFL